jgi:hypothetical protein
MPAIPDRLLRDTRPFNLTLRQWLSGIPAGRDLLTKQTDPRLFGFGDLGKGAKRGKKVDVAPGHGPARMILESRGQGPKGGLGFLTPDEWRDFAVDYLNFARIIHNRQPVPEWQ